MSARSSARWRLREATGDLHAELDGLLSRTDFDDSRSYAAFLSRQASPLFAIEDALDVRGIVSDMPDWSVRKRSQAMRRDLAHLGVAAPAPLAAPAHMASADAAFGVLYVLEGSRLGAKYLVRQARASRDPAARDATAYLAHGEDHSFWPTFLETLDRLDKQGLDHARLVAGARDAFALFIESARYERPVNAAEPQAV